jgi:hypothetical protein
MLEDGAVVGLLGSAAFAVPKMADMIDPKMLIVFSLNHLRTGGIA